MRSYLGRILLTGILLLVPAATCGAASFDVLSTTLNNGLRVVIVRNPLAPVVTSVVNCLVGSNEAPTGFPGMAHAQEHMMFRGSPSLSAGQLANIMAAMGGRANADTQQTVTQYFFTVPVQDFEVALRIEAIRMRDVFDSPKLWEQERGAIEQEVARDLSSPMYVFYSKLLAKMFAGTPYGHDALGTRPSFDKTTGTMLKRFYDTWYAPNNAILVIAGDIVPSQTLPMVKRFFESIPSRQLPERPKVRLREFKAATIRLESDLPYGMGIVAYRFPGYADPDFAACKILADILDSRRANLYTLVTEGRALFAGFESNMFPSAGIGFATVGFSSDSDGAERIGAIKNIIEGYKRKGIPADLVEAAKRHELTAAEFLKNSTEGLAIEWSRVLAIEGRSSLQEDIDAIMKVTVSDVNRVARRYLKNDSAIVGLLKPHPSGKPVVSRHSRTRESFAPSRTKSVTLPEWARRVLRPPLVVEGRQRTEFFLENGLRLIIQPETIGKSVGVYGAIQSEPGMQEPEGKEGVADVLAELFPYGTTTLNRLAFQKALDEIGAEESAGPRFSLQVLSEYLDRGVQLLSENLLQPALPESGFAIVQKEMIEKVSGRMKSPTYLSQRALLAGLYPEEDPGLRQATPKSVASLSLVDVKAYYRQTFRPDLTTIVVIGQVKAQQARAIIEKYFGHWRALGPKPPTLLPPVPLSRPSAVAVPDSSRVQDEVKLAQTLALTRSHPDYYALQLGLHVLSGGFYATRLYRDLRERTGLVYTIQAFIEARKSRSLFNLVFGCDPANGPRARALVVKNLEEMQKTPVSPAELKQAQALLIRQIILSESDTESIAEQLLNLSLEDLPLDEPVRAANRYRDITAKEVQAAFTKWIRPRDFVQVTLGPKSQ